MNTSGWPREIYILGKRYSVTYCEDPADVNPDPGAKAYNLGQCSKWDHSIRIWAPNEPTEILDTLLHEIIHLIADDLCDHINDEAHHGDLRNLATALADTLTRNGMIRPDLTVYRLGPREKNDG